MGAIVRGEADEAESDDKEKSSPLDLSEIHTRTDKYFNSTQRERGQQVRFIFFVLYVVYDMTE